MIWHGAHAFLLICFPHLRRFIRRFRNGAPGGRGRSFEPGDFQPVYVPLQNVICFFRHPKPALYQRALRFRLPAISNFPEEAEIRGFHVPCIRPNRRVRSVLSTGWASSVSGQLADPELASLPFWPKLISLFSLFKVTMVANIHIC